MKALKTTKQRLRVAIAILRLVVDVTMVVTAFVLAYYFRLWTGSPPAINIAPLHEYLGMLLIQVVAMITVFFFSRLYHLRRGTPLTDELYPVFAAVSIGTLFTTALTSLLYKNELDYPRLMIVYAWALTLLLVALGRLLVRRVERTLRRFPWAADRALIVGAGEAGQAILQKIRYSPNLGYKVIGFVDGTNSAREILGAPVLGRIEDLPALIDSYGIDEVIIGLPEASHQELLTIVSLCERGRVAIKVFPDVFQIMTKEVGIGSLGGLPLLEVRDIALRGWNLTLKRAMDLVLSAVGLVILSPFMLLMALLIKLDSPGPVFYAQERMGLDAQPFWMIKFRSMRQDAEATGPGWTTQGDPRVTRIGAILRRLSIDELPQLINVLIGEMSLVGPRPERPFYVEQFRRSIPRYMERHREKAGMTGWAQINGLRGDTSITERTKYDLWYIENWSLLLDLKILLRTLALVFTRDRNAY